MPRLPCVRRALMRCPSAVLVVIMIAVATAGCGGKKTKNDGTSSGDGAAASDSAIDPDTAFTVDDGRISVASPRGWTRAERSKEYLVKYQPGRKKNFPAIIVSAADAPAGFPAVSAENHAQFAAALAADMAEAFGQIGSSGLVKQPVAVTLGQHLGAAWSMPAQATVGGTKQTIEQQFYAVVVDGRMYTIAAQAPQGKLKADAKSAARAVAGAIALPAPAETFEPPAEPAPALEADAPADAEAKPAAEAAAQEGSPAAE